MHMNFYCFIYFTLPIFITYNNTIPELQLTIQNFNMNPIEFIYSYRLVFRTAEGT